MPVMRGLVVTLALATLVACGDHYEGGGRRNEIPGGGAGGTPNVSVGDGMSSGGTSSMAGTSAAEGGAGEGGTFPFPFPLGGSGGSAGSGEAGGSGGTGG